MGVLEERRAIDETWKADVTRRLDEHFERLEAGDARFERMEKTLASANEAIAGNTRITEGIKADTGELVTWLNNVKGFRNVLRGLGDILIRASLVIIAFGVVYWFATTGQLPRKVKLQPVLPTAIVAIEPRRYGRRRRPKDYCAWSPCGVARPARPAPLYAEDFSMLVRHKRLHRAAGAKVHVVS